MGTRRITQKYLAQLSLMSNKEGGQATLDHIPTRAEMLKSQLKQRKYFDSGDYAMSKAGKKPEPGQEIGSEHPQPRDIPHRSAFLASAKENPVRRHSNLNQSSGVLRKAVSRSEDYEDAAKDEVVEEE